MDVLNRVIDTIMDRTGLISQVDLNTAISVQKDKVLNSLTDEFDEQFAYLSVLVWQILETVKKFPKFPKYVGHAVGVSSQHRRTLLNSWERSIIEKTYDIVSKYFSSIQKI